jgi:hypothetical protein
VITPTKHLSPDRSLVYVGAEILVLLDEPRTVSGLWHDIGPMRHSRGERTRLTFDWYVLALDLLFTLGAIDFRSGELSKRQS